MSDKDTTRVDGIVRWFKNNRIISVIIVAALIVIGVAQFTDSIDKIRKFVRPDTPDSDKTQPKKKDQVSFDSGTIRRIMSETKVSIDTIFPSPEQATVPPNQAFSVSAVATYSFPDWIDGMELSLKVNRDPEDGRFWHSVTERRLTTPQGRQQLSGLIPAIPANELAGHRLKLVGELVLFDNASGVRHVVAVSAPVYFETKK